MLSTNTSSRRPASARARSSTGELSFPSMTLSAAATAGNTSAGSRSGAKGAQNTPSGYASDASAAACNASLVFPVPPGPTNETRRTSGSSSIPATTASSSSRPRNGVAGTGRFDRCSDFNGGNEPSPNWNTRSVARKSLNLCSPRSRNGVSTSVAVEPLTSTCPPLPAAAIRAARCRSAPTYPSSVTSGVPVCNPIRTRIGSSSNRSVITVAASTASGARANARRNASPCVSTSTPPSDTHASRTIRRWSSSATAYLSGPSSSSSRVDPSTSVNRNVTVPEGRSARTRGSCDTVQHNAQLGRARTPLACLLGYEDIGRFRSPNLFGRWP